MSEQFTTEWEHRIIDGISYAIYQTEHSLGLGDNAWLRSQIANGPSDDKLKVAVEIAVAFLHFSQDKKKELTAAQQRVAFLTEQCRVLCKSHTEFSEANQVLLQRVQQLQHDNHTAAMMLQRRDADNEQLKQRVAELEQLLN